MSVVAADRDKDACARAAEALSKFGDRIRVIEADIGTPEGARRAVEAAIEAFGRIDLLCNNAAYHPMETVEDHDIATWREAFRVNVDGCMLCSKYALPHMKRQGGGAIVNIGSVSGLVPYARGGAYAASKAAIAMLTRVLALEAGGYGVTVNCIAPGSIRHREEDLAQGEAPSSNPIGRSGKPADVASLVSYLASEEAGYITGTTITLDGGATAGRLRVSRRRDGQQSTGRKKP
jgi:meso-butanediol dehydrogenase/(S,S)-butanediol dehydrogenase/diacetyl reductase